MLLEFLQLHQILLPFINFVMIIIVGATLMKTFFQFRPWPQGKFSTKARVKMVFTLSILNKLLNSLYLPRSTIMSLGILFSISHFGT